MKSLTNCLITVLLVSGISACSKSNNANLASQKDGTENFVFHPANQKNESPATANPSKTKPYPPTVKKTN